MFHLQRSIQRPRLDDVQPQFLPGMYHSMDHTTGRAGTVSFLQRASAFERAFDSSHETIKAIERIFLAFVAQVVFLKSFTTIITISVPDSRLTSRGG